MKTDEALKLIDNKDFLDKIYHFSYARSASSFEAEDLCSEIILAVVSAVQRTETIENFHAFVWKIARNVYADHCEKRSHDRRTFSLDVMDFSMADREDEIEAFIEEAADAESIRKIFSEIAFLSKAYRDVMVMYYIDELGVKDIAARLKISESTVKQRLFSARNTIRKEVKTMNDRKLSLKPIRLAISGTGHPSGNDPSTKTERVFSQNLIYLCKDRPRTAKELSDELCVPMTYVEDELEIQCKGENGEYGMLRRLDNGRYAINALVVDYEEYDTANKIYEKHLPEFCENLKLVLRKNRDKILSFPYLSSQNDLRFILWSMISRTIWDFSERINKVIAKKYFADVTPAKREYTCVAVAFRDEQNPEFEFYGCDGTNADMVGGYKHVFVSNINGKRIEPHFYFGHNVSQDTELLMVLKAIGGLRVDELTETMKEYAAKAIKSGYLRKNGNILEPKIIVIDDKDSEEFFKFSYDFNENMGDIIEDTAGELAAFMKEHIPEHLFCEYRSYTELIAGIRILHQTIEACLEEGLLSKPGSQPGAEGVLMVVRK